MNLPQFPLTLKYWKTIGLIICKNSFAEIARLIEIKGFLKFRELSLVPQNSGLLINKLCFTFSNAFLKSRKVLKYNYILSELLKLSHNLQCELTWFIRFIEIIKEILIILLNSIQII